MAFIRSANAKSMPYAIKIARESPCARQIAAPALGRVLASSPESIVDVQICLFGSFNLEVAGEPQTSRIPTKAQAVLAYTASQIGRAVLRDRLADLAWPRSGPEQARQSLRQALFAIRHAFASSSECRLASTSFHSIRLTGANVDIHIFEKLANSKDLADLERAASVYRGEFLSEFPSISTSFDLWRSTEQSRLVDTAGRVLTQLAEIYLTLGRAEEALVVGQRLVALDNLREDAHRLLIRCYGACGRRCDALREYESYRLILQRELRVLPDSATTELAERIRASNGFC
jgi:DNA-binding SARP family transcriptional activator